MQITIDLPEEMWEQVKDGYVPLGISKYLKNGTPQPEIRHWEEIDKQDIEKSVILLDLFTKTYCRYQNDYERFDDLKFRCEECPFGRTSGICLCKAFKHKYAPDYKDFGCMGDL